MARKCSTGVSAVKQNFFGSRPRAADTRDHARARSSSRKGKWSLVGTARFELATPCTPSKCATRLRYVPMESAAEPAEWGPT